MSIEMKDDKAQWIASLEIRKERADYYFQTILENQREWYSRKASNKKVLHYGFAVSVIVLGTLISCLQAWQGDWVRYLTTAMGAGVTILRSVDSLLRPGETWHTYRKAEERMKLEYRLYINNAEAYGEAVDETAAFRLLVTRVENVIAEEQQLFWQFQDKTPAQPMEGKGKLPAA